MKDNLEALANMSYPGRFIILGRDISTHPHNQHNIIVYGITGRSSSSQARKLVLKDEKDDREARIPKIYVEPTDLKLLEQGNPDLLIYPAITIKYGVAVSNGKQTDEVGSWAELKSPLFALVHAHERWSYEPDEPNFTPRISGLIRDNSAALGIIKRDNNDEAIKQFFKFPLIPGKGKLITTYTGENIDPLPSFRGEPLDVELPYKNNTELAKAVYEALAPKKGRSDFRVSVAAVFYNTAAYYPRTTILNKVDMIKDKSS